MSEGTAGTYEGKQMGRISDRRPFIQDLLLNRLLMELMPDEDAALNQRVTDYQQMLPAGFGAGTAKTRHRPCVRTGMMLGVLKVTVFAF